MLLTPVLQSIHQSQPMAIFAFIILELHFHLSIKLLIVMFLDSISLSIMNGIQQLVIILLDTVKRLG